MKTIQPIIRKKWLELLAVAQIAIFIFVVGSLQPVNSQIPPDASANCSTSCQGGGCSITVANYVQCDNNPDYACAFLSANCNCNCSCGTSVYEMGPDGEFEYVYQANFSNGGSCGN